jgi:hypothetical protein
MQAFSRSHELQRDSSGNRRTILVSSGVRRMNCSMTRSSSQQFMKLCEKRRPQSSARGEKERPAETVIRLMVVNTLESE